MKKLFILPILLTTSILVSSQEEEEMKDLPGYRAAYLEQTLDVDYLSTSPKKTHHGSFCFGDSHAMVTKVISKRGSGDISIVGGVRKVHLELGSHIRSKNTLYGVLGATIEYTGMCRWLWTAGAVAQPDLKWVDLARNTRYIGDIHGRFEYTKAIGIHAGIYSEVGMRVTNVRPIIGADYTSGTWIYQAIFPLKAGVSYTGIDHQTFSCMIRPLYTAVKIHKGLHHHPAVAKYEGSGAEVRWDLTPNQQWNFWATLGHTIGSSLMIGDTNFHHQKDIHIKQAPYIQIGLTVSI